MTALDLEAIKRYVARLFEAAAVLRAHGLTELPRDIEIAAGYVAEVERLLAREASTRPLLVEVMAWLVNDQVRGPFNAPREALIQRLSAALDGDFAKLDEAQAEREEAIERRAKADALREVLQMVQDKNKPEARDAENGIHWACGYGDACAEIFYEIESLLPQEPTNAA